MSKKFYFFSRIIFGSIYIFLLFFFSYESLKDGKVSANSSNTFRLLLSILFYLIFKKKLPCDLSFKIFVRKGIGHFGYFFLLGCVSFYFYLFIFKKKTFPIFLFFHVGSGMIFMFLTEFLFQNIAVHRFPSFSDVALDSSGFFLATLLFLFFFLISKKR